MFRFSTIVFLAGVLNCAPAFSSILGTATNFAVLGGSTVTNGASVLNGNLGLYPGTSITGMGSIVYIGASAMHNSDAVAQQAQTDAASAYLAFQSLPYTIDLTGHNLGGLTLTPGVYRFTSSAQLTGLLTLDALGNPNSQFVFQIGTTLTTASASNVTVINGTQGTGVYFQVGSSATLGTGSTFVGNILASKSITLTTNAKIECGRALADVGAVTLDTNVISNNCASYNGNSRQSDFGSSGFDGTAIPQAVPEPGTIILMCFGTLAMLLFRRGSGARLPV